MALPVRNDHEDLEQIQTLISDEIDKLKIENKLL